MNEIILKRLQEIAPVKRVQDMSISELVKDCNIAFKIIGYEPKNLEKSVEKIYVNHEIELLSDFIYCVWRVD